MSSKSQIEWTRADDGSPGATWNPVRGCTKVSAGCKNCYAERFAERFRGVPGHAFEQGFSLRLVHEALDLPLGWRKPRRVFVNSMSDLFHEGVDEEFIARVFGTMAATPRHTFQILTKRASRMREVLSAMDWEQVGAYANATLDLVRGERWRYVDRAGRELGDDPGRLAHGLEARPWHWPLPNVWVGVSVEDQAAAYDRIPHLIETPAALRFLSCEPLLGPVDLSPWLSADLGERGRARLGLLHWVIAGGESGPRARELDVAWVRGLVEQCRAAGIPAFVKQMGSWWARTQDNLPDPKGADPEEWPEDLRVRQMPEVAGA